MKCFACGTELNKKEALYTEDRKAFCPNPFECGHPLHPNSVDNIVKRGAAINLYNDTDIETAIFETMDIPPEIKDRISKVATKPQSVRIQRNDLAYYLIKLQEVKGFSSISESVRFCIETAMTVEPIKEVSEHSLVKPVEKQEMKPGESYPVEKVEPIVKKASVTIIPKAKEEPKPEPEEEFTF